MKTIILFLVICALLNSLSATAQHEHHQMPMQKTPSSRDQKKSAAKMNMKGIDADKSKKDTIKAMNDPMTNDSMKMNDHDMMNMDTTKSGMQNDHDLTNMDSTKSGMQNDHDMKMDGQVQHNETNMEMMTSSYSLNLPMSRDGSGTSWVPDASNMYMLMKMSGKTTLMLHGNIFLRYTKQDLFNKGNRGDDKFDAPNWFMGMLSRPVGKKGLFSASAMISLDGLTEGGNGYPLLFQSGETWKGQKLVDRQHPHDLFSALTIGYSYAVNKNTDVYGYIGYPGEPALGPPVFMHRNSAMNNPDAPLSHHWQDATHITFGVATLGFRYKIFKIEGSVFTGREPDEDRYGLDKARFDSYSYRVSLNPNENWALQFSQGFLNNPETSEPNVDITRTTASILYSKHFPGLKAHLDGTLVWGLNSPDGSKDENSLLLEGNLQFDKSAVYTRYEFVQKSGEELDLFDEFGDRRFNINAVSVGYNYTLLPGQSFDLSAGTKATLNISDKMLQNLYGKTPIGCQIYLRLRPAVHGH